MRFSHTSSLSKMIISPSMVVFDTGFSVCNALQMATLVSHDDDGNGFLMLVQCFFFFSQSSRNIAAYDVSAHYHCKQV